MLVHEPGPRPPPPEAAPHDHGGQPEVQQAQGDQGQGGYDRYDNFDAIEVPFTDAIPSDYDGVMGVPITFLDKYNPDQFEIVGTGRP